MQTRVVQVFVALNHLFHLLFSDFEALRFLRKFFQPQMPSKLRFFFSMRPALPDGNVAAVLSFC